MQVRCCRNCGRDLFWFSNWNIREVLSSCSSGTEGVSWVTGHIIRISCAWNVLKRIRLVPRYWVTGWFVNFEEIVMIFIFWAIQGVSKWNARWSNNNVNFLNKLYSKNAVFKILVVVDFFFHFLKKGLVKFLCNSPQYDGLGD